MNHQASKMDLSIVIPVYCSQESLPALLNTFSLIDVECSWELVFVEDGSPDDSYSVLLDRLRRMSTINATVVRHTRNYGEHQAVLTGYRYSKGRYIVNIDDDMQNPPEEAFRLFDYAVRHGIDVLYGDYAEKQHQKWRNLGSRAANITANYLLDLPTNLYLSSFRCVESSIAKMAANYKGPYPYIDGLLSQCTKNIDSIEVLHMPREHGNSTYNLRRLLRLWLNIFTSFSLMPLRLSSLIGASAAILGLAGISYVLINTLLFGEVVSGWASLICVMLLFGGLQSMMIGIVGEYVGRILLTVSAKPQSNVRSVEII